MIILHQNFPMHGNNKEMQDGHHHKNHVGDLGCGMGDTSSAFALGKYCIHMYRQYYK